MAFLSSGDATFRLLENFLRYVNIVAQHVNIVAQPRALAARTPCRSEAVYASRLMTQKRLRLARPALRQVA